MTSSPCRVSRSPRHCPAALSDKTAQLSEALVEGGGDETCGGHGGPAPSCDARDGGVGHKEEEKDPHDGHGPQQHVITASEIGNRVVDQPSLVSSLQSSTSQCLFVLFVMVVAHRNHFASSKPGPGL